MFKKRGLLIVLLMLACLASCAEPQPDTKTKQLNQSKAEEMNLLNVDNQSEVVQFNNKT